MAPINKGLHANILAHARLPGLRTEQNVASFPPSHLFRSSLQGFQIVSYVLELFFQVTTLSAPKQKMCCNVGNFLPASPLSTPSPQLLESYHTLSCWAQAEAGQEGIQRVCKATWESARDEAIGTCEICDWLSFLRKVCK